MLEFLRRSPVLRLAGGRAIGLTGIRAEGSGRVGLLADLQPAVVWIHAEAETDGRTVALSFGPMHGAVTAEQVAGAADQARAGGFETVLVFGVAFSPAASQRAAECGAVLVHAAADLHLGELLKTTRSSEIFAVTGTPDLEIDPVTTTAASTSESASAKSASADSASADSDLAGAMLTVRLLGVDVFDPASLDVRHLDAADVPAWFLDPDFDGRTFRAAQAFFPRTKAFEALRKAIGADPSEILGDLTWGHGTVSAPFEPGPHGRVAVKVIDDRGQELVAVRLLGISSRPPGTGARTRTGTRTGTGAPPRTRTRA